MEELHRVAAYAFWVWFKWCTLPLRSGQREAPAARRLRHQQGASRLLHFCSIQKFYCSRTSEAAKGLLKSSERTRYWFLNMITFLTFLEVCFIATSFLYSFQWCNSQGPFPLKRAKSFFFFSPEKVEKSVLLNAEAEEKKKLPFKCWTQEKMIIQLDSSEGFRTRNVTKRGEDFLSVAESFFQGFAVRRGLFKIFYFLQINEMKFHFSSQGQSISHAHVLALKLQTDKQCLKFYTWRYFFNCAEAELYRSWCYYHYSCLSE